jgi:ATP-dependent Clp protease ATP-binding subunit ClpB
VFHPLNHEQLAEVLQIELGQLQQRILETHNGRFLFRMTDAGRKFLLSEGTDQRYGARHLKRAIERHVVFPLANLLATGQVKAGDMLCIDWDPRVRGLVFWKEDEVSRPTLPQPQLTLTPTRKAAGAGGRSAEVTSSTKARSA